MLNDDEIVTYVRAESDPVDDKTDDDEDSKNVASDFMYYKDRIRFSVIRTITYLKGDPVPIDSDSDEDMKLNESDCEESEESENVIDNTPVNPDTYIYR
ncbi:hypothetical protein TNCV_3518451 [Trichonephila clavipes]|uniref:Uncharacterized protein n=1 Tax=Trichonephila clavipes TaxID=2585209 RepID=A0A8X6SU70_TRICX|nr:hypothetical protein TNCV_3518451 [Trichonephila clavipes]